MFLISKFPYIISKQLRLSNITLFSSFLIQYAAFRTNKNPSDSHRVNFRKEQIHY